MKLFKKLRSSNKVLLDLRKILVLIWQASGYWTIAWIILLLLQGLLPVFSLALTRQAVNTLVIVAGKGVSTTNIYQILIPVGLMAAILLLGEFFNAAAEWIRTVQSELLQDYINGLIHKQSVTVDYSFYEYSEYNDKLERAREKASGRSLALLENIGSLLQKTITLLAIIIVLLPYGLLLPIGLVISAVPAFYILIHLNKIQYKWSRRNTTTRRRLSYYDMLLTSNTTAAEIRLFDFANYFQSSYQKLRQRLRAEQLQLLKQQTIGRLIAVILILLVTGGALVWMGRQVLLGIFTLGDLALFFQAFNRAQNIVKAILSNLGKIYRHSLFVSNLFEFLQIQPKIIDPPHPVPIPSVLKGEIRFRKVTFSYPGTQKPVLKNFDLTLPSGKVVAIVGDNGAGKSTLIKLLCRFYDPDTGSIDLDGINLRDFRVKDWRRLITVLFQSPIPYHTTASENIALGDISNTSYQTDIKAAAIASGIHNKIMSLPSGYNTMMGKLFPDGTDLSGGEWQRLALARAFFRRSEIMILDEPTSAMDPWSEQDWLERFRTLARGRTAVVITHRFTLAMQADIIHVMRSGQIVESGSHKELLKQNGFYATSWRSQMQTSSISSIN
ncbi:ABC transporter ATP-binding protein [Mastigocoleus sp. MO_188.B34]|uniref:ABC transporter ATP-binding protein n=1 Tax=Mastigocoleus sp. MO_188.B34 TaxID=3036635 RepID=UPI002605BA35|nr:ABC transporter ATP-binding protein [Mastigocoleus sp. MO_188.B34]MDJ0692954.1 ABC transporter ATP-binding protein [Mastigocoleus sp. MO_188.B34]